jgi:ADP-ribosylglycohydrolase
MPFSEMLISLRGLSVGDAFGYTFGELRWVKENSASRIQTRELARGPWRWTDDTHMALSVVEVLREYGHIDEDALAQAFARRYADQPRRGYGGGARRLLWNVAQGGDWRTEAAAMFDGTGSFGNGSAMRVAPLGAFFAGDLPRTVAEADRSAAPTHTHPEGRAGAVAVAVAAALVAGPGTPSGNDLLAAVIAHTPESAVRDGLRRALELPGRDAQLAAARLGNGARVSCPDTVPFCLWVVARYLGETETALWATAGALGDIDTNCAIVGGILALVNPVPDEWLRRREALPPGFEPEGEDA